MRSDTDELVRKHEACLYVRCGLKFAELEVGIPNEVAIFV